MKKYLIKLTALLILVSFALSSCSVEYRERHRHHDGDDHHDHYYHNY